MEKKDSPKPQRKKSMGKIRIAFSAMILFVLFLMEIYLMVNATQYFIGLVTVSVLLIAVLYILVTSVIQVNYEKEQELLDEFDDIFKSEKATYLLMRKSFEDFNERLAFLEDNTKTPTEEIIAAQKAIAKVSISRNKENTDALMNSNDKLLERFFTFEDILNENNDKLLEQQKLIISQANQEILMKQQEVISRLKELELSIKNEILQAVNTVTSSQPQVVLSNQMPVAPQEMKQPEPIAEPEIMTEAPAMEEPEISLEEAVTEEPEIAVEEPVTEEPEISLEEAVTEEPEIVAEEPVTEELEVAVEEPVTEEPEISLEEAVTEEPEIVAEEPVIEEPEVAAEEPEVVAEEDAGGEPEIVEEAPAEEKPPMPDLSDPNHVMTPDEIAALLANM